MIAILTHLSYCGNAGPPAFLKFLLPYWHYGLPFAKHISIHVHQALILFSYLVDMEHSSKGSAKEAYLAHIDKRMQCHQICFPMQCFYVTIAEVVPGI